MARFSLGGAYAQNGQHAEAAEAYLECVGINEHFSKAYQLAGKALIDAGDESRAGEVLDRGYLIAAKQGDLMPKNGIGELLASIGRTPPEVPAEAEKKSAVVTGDGFVCKRTKRPGTRMARAPFRGGLGTWIQDNISQETFNEWIGLGTKIINELRLDLSREQDDAVYDYGMRRFLGLTDEKYAELAGSVPPAPGGEYVEMIDTILARSGQLEEFGGELHKKV